MFKFLYGALFFLDLFVIILFYFVIFFLDYLPVFEDDLKGFFQFVIFLLLVSILLLKFFDFEL